MPGLGDWIRHNAHWRGDATALGLGESSFTYAQTHREVDRRCHVLAHELNLRPGSVVAYLGPNSCDVLFLLFACARARCVLLPLNNRLAAPELIWILEHSGTRALINHAGFAGLANEIREANPGIHSVSHDRWQDLVDEALGHDFGDDSVPDDPVLLVYTSGTTGKPKGVVHTQRSLYFNALNAAHAQEMSARDHVLSVLPLFHVGGLNIQTTPALYLGARVTLLERFDPGATLAAIRELRPSMFLAVPAVIQALMQHPDWTTTDLSCLRMVGTGSSTVPHPLLAAWHERGVPATQIYGLTESAPAAICLPINDSVRKQGAAGKPVLYCQARIVDGEGTPVVMGTRGEIQIRGPNLFSEYLQDPEQTQAAFDGDWFRTGDIGHVDEDGFYHIDDRKKDVIISGGENIYPAELENVLADMPELAEYSVVGRADPKWGETAVACVVLHPDAQLDEVTLLTRFEGRLARFKHPRAVRFFDTLPRNAMGKVLKFELKTWL